MHPLSTGSENFLAVSPEDPVKAEHGRQTGGGSSSQDKLR